MFDELIDLIPSPMLTRPRKRDEEPEGEPEGDPEPCDD